ncbi:unnamed protein product [Durusdinium trenchii]|uniref:Uncharacterized protein n=2 Tax=Durusdinium trenchii TaxID=1381693 RepID=A0ABP0N2N9_9DINO
MGCTSSADKYGTVATPSAKATPATPASPASPASPTSAEPAASPAGAGAAGAGTTRRGSRVVEENTDVIVGSRRAAPMVGLRQDADGDEAHEFFVEDPKTGEMRQVTRDLVELG